jgi:hypothetical protein
MFSATLEAGLAAVTDGIALSASSDGMNRRGFDDDCHLDMLAWFPLPPGEDGPLGLVPVLVRDKSVQRRIAGSRRIEIRGNLVVIEASAISGDARDSTHTRGEVYPTTKQARAHDVGSRRWGKLTKIGKSARSFSLAGAAELDGECVTDLEVSLPSRRAA